jgi:Kef-type K+ transport system membrane component KefB
VNTSLQILFFVAVIILVAKLAGALSARLGLPLIMGELLAGVVLGPTVLDIFSLPILRRPEGPEGVSVASVFYILAEVGVVLLMFVAGLETDMVMMRTTVAPAFWAAAGGVVLPMAGGVYLARLFHFSWPEAVFIGTILTATSVTITAQTLMNLKQLRSRAGSTILSAAVIDDVMGLIVLSLVIALAPQLAGGGQASWRGMTITILKMAICIITMFWFGPIVTKWVMHRATRLHGHHTEAAAALIVAFLIAFDAQWFGGMAAITGAYVAGLFLAQTRSHERVLQDLHPMVNSLFGPIFFVSIGLAVNARHVSGSLLFFTLLLVIALAGKIVGCGLGARLNGFTNRESMVVGIGMIPRGEVGLITASLGLAAGLVTRDIYVQIVVLVLITTLITPAMLKYAFPPAPSAVSATAVAIDNITLSGEAERSVASGF